MLQHGIGEATTSIPTLFPPLKDKDKEEIDRAVAEFIITDFQPFHVVEAPSFRHLLCKLNPSYTLPHRTAMTTDVLKMCKEVESNVETEIQKLKWIAITVDGCRQLQIVM